MKRYILITALTLLLLFSLVSCASSENTLPRYTPSGNAPNGNTLSNPTLRALASFDGFSATREPIQNDANGLSESFEAPAVSKRLFTGSDRATVYGSYVYYRAMKDGNSQFCRLNTENGMTESLCPDPACTHGKNCVFRDGLLLCYAVVGDESAPYLFYAVNNATDADALSDDTWSTALYCFDTATGRSYTVIESCAAIHRIFGFAISGDRIYIDASIYALNTESGLITTTNALLSVSVGGGDIDVLILNGDSVYLDAFFLANGAVSILSYRYDADSTAFGTGRVTEQVIRIDPVSGEIGVTDVPEVLRDVALRTVIGDSVYFGDGCICRLPLNDLSAEPVFVSDEEWQMCTDTAFYRYDVIVKETDGSYSQTLDLNSFCRVNTDGTSERIFGSEEIKIVETVAERNGLLYCRAYFTDAPSADVYLVGIELSSGRFTVLDTTERLS